MDDSDLSDLLARAAEVSRRVVDALRRGGAQRSFSRTTATTPTGRAARRGRCKRPRTWPKTCTDWSSRTDSEVAWVDGTRRNVRLRLSPIDVGPALSATLWGDVTSVLTSATIPPRIVERVGLEGFPTEELNVGSPFDYRSHALLYVARHLPDRRAAGRRGGAARGAGGS